MRPFVKRIIRISDDPEEAKLQARALVGLVNSAEAQLHYYREKDYSLSEARLVALEEALESEKRMNAILTEELEQLQ